MNTFTRLAAQSLQPQLVAWRRELHTCPEVRDQTYLTAAILVRELRRMGITEIQENVGGSGVVAVIKGERPGKCLGIRADCDGLPIKEETGLPFASTNGNMHACGHDAHSAMALGAARLLQENSSDLIGTVKLIFQPFEEGDGGAKAMINDGVLENPHVDAMVALHIGNIQSELNSGVVGWTAKPSSFCITAFWAKFQGKGTHVATPHQGIDPILMACNAVSQMQVILSRECDPAKQNIVAVCKIEGGVRNNIIPEICTVEGSIRSDNAEDQRWLFQRVGEIFQSVAQGQRGQLEIGQTFDLMATRNDPDMLRRFLAIAPAVVEPNRLQEVVMPSPMGEDFARFADRVPSFYFFLSSRPQNRVCYPHHHPKFDIDETDLQTGTALFTEYALRWQTV
jgi:amidohydrolase